MWFFLLQNLSTLSNLIAFNNRQPSHTHTQTHTHSHTHTHTRTHTHTHSHTYTHGILSYDRKTLKPPFVAKKKASSASKLWRVYKFALICLLKRAIFRSNLAIVWRQADFVSRSRHRGEVLAVSRRQKDGSRDVSLLWLPNENCQLGEFCSVGCISFGTFYCRLRNP